MVKLVYKSDNCANTLGAILPESFESLDKCVEYLSIARTIFLDGYKWHILHDDEFVYLILGHEVLCEYRKEN